jgi:hypothetical protein
VVIVGEKPSDNPLFIVHHLATTVSVTPRASVQISILQKCDALSFGSWFTAFSNNVVVSFYFFLRVQEKTLDFSTLDGKITALS